MQLFFQSIILYIVYGPGTSKIQSISFQKVNIVKLTQISFDFDSIKFSLTHSSKLKGGE